MPSPPTTWTPIDQPSRAHQVAIFEELLGGEALPAAALGVVGLFRPRLAPQGAAVFPLAVEVDLDAAETQRLVSEPGAGADPVELGDRRVGAPRHVGMGHRHDPHGQLAAVVGVDVSRHLGRDDGRVDDADDAEPVEHRLDQAQRREPLGEGRLGGAVPVQGGGVEALHRRGERRRPGLAEVLQQLQPRPLHVEVGVDQPGDDRGALGLAHRRAGERGARLLAGADRDDDPVLDREGLGPRARRVHRDDVADDYQGRDREAHAVDPNNERLDTSLRLPDDRRIRPPRRHRFSVLARTAQHQGRLAPRGRRRPLPRRLRRARDPRGGRQRRRRRLLRRDRARRAARGRGQLRRRRADHDPHRGRRGDHDRRPRGLARVDPRRPLHARARRDDPDRPPAHGGPGRAGRLDHGAEGVRDDDLRPDRRRLDPPRGRGLRGLPAARRGDRLAPQGLRTLARQRGDLPAERAAAAGRRALRPGRPRAHAAR